MKEKLEKKDNRKKIIIISILILALILLSTGFFIICKIRNDAQIEEQNETKTKEQIEAQRILDEKLNKCYIAIYDNRDFEEYKKIISTFDNENEKKLAYAKLEECLDNLINNYFNDYTLEQRIEFNNFFDVLKKDNSIDETLKSIIEKEKNYKNSMSYFSEAEQHVENGNYHKAYLAYGNAKRDLLNNYPEKRALIDEKLNSIKNKAEDSLKEELAENINAQDYSKSYSLYNNFVKNSDNEELKDIYAQYNDGQKSEKNAKEKERKKQQGVSIGMTKQEVLDSNWGEPERINKSTYSWGTKEQWVYPNYNYLYFENDKLTSIQTSE